MAHSDTRLHQEETSLAQWWRTFQQQRERGQTQKIHIFVRSVSPTPGMHAYRNQLLDSIKKASRREHIDTYELTVLGDDICLCDNCESNHTTDQLVELVEKLRTWRTGGMKACGFTERTVESSITDESYQTVTPPDITLGVFCDDSLAGVFPCQADGTVYRPGDFVDDLRETDIDTSGKDQRVSGIPR